VLSQRKLLAQRTEFASWNVTLYCQVLSNELKKTGNTTRNARNSEERPKEVPQRRSIFVAWKVKAIYIKNGDDRCICARVCHLPNIHFVLKSHGIWTKAYCASYIREKSHNLMLFVEKTNIVCYTYTLSTMKLVRTRNERNDAQTLLLLAAETVFEV